MAENTGKGQGELVGSEVNSEGASLAGRNVVEEKTLFWQDPKWAERHFKNAGKRPQAVAVPILKRVLELIPSQSKVLDVGCGHGRYSIPLAEAGHQVVASDVSGAMLEILVQNRGDLAIEVRQGDAHHLAAKDAEFDVVFANDFMGHFPDWAVLLKEQARVCRPGGKVIFSLAFTEHREFADQFEELHAFDHVYSNDVQSKRPFRVEISKPELETVAAQCGLVVESLIPLKHFHESFVFGRVLGTEGHKAFVKEFRERLLAEPAVQEFYDWLELNLFQKLPFESSYMTMIVLTKPVMNEG